MRKPTRLLSLAMVSAAVAGGMSSARADDGLAADGMAQPAAEKALAGQSWRLVQILSMDDTTYAPEERSNYTLTFTADGDVQIGADCNRGIGSWESLTPGALTFGEIAATRAMCPPGSLHDRFMAQFPRVRSYVVQGGHLFLATMADGSIIELEPAPLAATVLGEAVHTGDAEELQQIVLTRLFDHFAAQQGIAVTDAEIDDYVEHMRREMQAQGLHAEDDLTQEEAALVAQMRRDMGRAMIHRWKLNKALHVQYGGRIVFQQFGPEPLDAYRRYLEERQAAGDFEIHDQAMADTFWRYFADDAMHSFYEPGSEAQVFSAPPWERQQPEG